MDIGAFGKGKGKQGKSKHGKDSKDETGIRRRTRTRIRLNSGLVESADTTRKTVGARRRTPTFQSAKYGKKLPGHFDLTVRAATGEHVKSGERLYVEGCAIGESISKFEVFKRRCVNHCCLLENTQRCVESLSCMVT